MSLYTSWRAVLVGLLLLVPHLLYVTPVIMLRHLTWKRLDAFWLAAAIMLLAASTVHGSLAPELITLVLAFAAFKGGESLAVARRTELPPHFLQFPLLGATAVLVGYACFEVFWLGEARAAGPAWMGHPNHFAYVLVILGLATTMVTRMPIRLLILPASVAGILLTGSRSALLALFVALVLIAIMDRRLIRKTVLTFSMSLSVVVVAYIAFPGAPWAQRILSTVVSIVGIERPSRNLFIFTEAVTDAQYWNSIGVTVERSSASRIGRAAFTVVRTEEVNWARPQQAVHLERGQIYTLSALLRQPEHSHLESESDWRPGFIGWGGNDNDRVQFIVGLTSSSPEVLATRGIELATVRSSPVRESWQRVEFTFSTTGEGTVRLAVGVSPGPTSTSLGDATEVSELQLELGSDFTGYVPAIAQLTGLGEALIRREITRVAWRGVREKPIWGHGPESFAEYFATESTDTTLVNHTHNIYLHAWFSLGIFGLLALLCVMLALVKSSGLAERGLLLGTFIGNLFDSTLTAGAVAYLLAFLSPMGQFVADNRSFSSRKPEKIE